MKERCGKKLVSYAKRAAELLTDRAGKDMYRSSMALTTSSDIPPSHTAAATHACTLSSPFLPLQVGVSFTFACCVVVWTEFL